jgi:hypothetical protein
MNANSTKSNEDVKTRALADCLNPELTLSDIAERHRIPIWKLKYWIRRAALPARRRGGRPATDPPARIRDILDHAVAHGIIKTAEQFNVTKQYVSSLAKRWNVRLLRRSLAVHPSPQLQLKGRQKKSRRDVVVSFRLREDELLSLRSLKPMIVNSPTKSHHKFVRAIVLAQLGTVCPSPTQPAP